MSLRFRIDLKHDKVGWEAVVYDMADHGPDMPYAGASARDLGAVLHEAVHYVLMADDTPVGDHDPDGGMEKLRAFIDLTVPASSTSDSPEASA